MYELVLEKEKSHGAEDDGNDERNREGWMERRGGSLCCKHER